MFFSFFHYLLHRKYSIGTAASLSKPTLFLYQFVFQIIIITIIIIIINLYIPLWYSWGRFCICVTTKHLMMWCRGCNIIIIIIILLLLLLLYYYYYISIIIIITLNIPFRWIQRKERRKAKRIRKMVIKWFLLY